MKNTLVLSSTTSKKLSSTLLVALLFYNTGSIFAKELTPQEVSVPTSSTQNWNATHLKLQKIPVFTTKMMSL